MTETLQSQYFATHPGATQSDFQAWSNANGPQVGFYKTFAEKHPTEALQEQQMFARFDAGTAGNQIVKGQTYEVPVGEQLTPGRPTPNPLYNTYGANISAGLRQQATNQNTNQNNIRYVAVDFQAVKNYNAMNAAAGINNAQDYFNAVRNPAPVQNQPVNGITSFNQSYTPSPYLANDTTQPHYNSQFDTSNINFTPVKNDIYPPFQKIDTSRHLGELGLSTLSDQQIKMAFQGYPSIVAVPFGLATEFVGGVVQGTKGTVNYLFNQGEKAVSNPLGIPMQGVDIMGDFFQGNANLIERGVNSIISRNPYAISELGGEIYAYGKMGEVAKNLPSTAFTTFGKLVYPEATSFAKLSDIPSPKVPIPVGGAGGVPLYTIEGRQGVLVPPDLSAGTGTLGIRGIPTSEYYNPISGFLSEPPIGRESLMPKLANLEPRIGGFARGTNEIVLNQNFQPNPMILAHEIGHTIDVESGNVFSDFYYDKLTESQKQAANNYYKQLGYSQKEIPKEYFADSVGILTNKMLGLSDTTKIRSGTEAFINPDELFKNEPLREEIAASLSRITQERTGQTLMKAPELQTQLFPKRLSPGEMEAFNKLSGYNPIEGYKPQTLFELGQSNPALAKELAKSNGQTVFNPDVIPRVRDLTSEEQFNIAKRQAIPNPELQKTLTGYPTKVGADVFILKNGQKIVGISDKTFEFFDNKKGQLQSPGQMFYPVTELGNIGRDIYTKYRNEGFMNGVSKDPFNANIPLVFFKSTTDNSLGFKNYPINSLSIFPSSKSLPQGINDSRINYKILPSSLQDPFSGQALVQRQVQAQAQASATSQVVPQDQLFVFNQSIPPNNDNFRFGGSNINQDPFSQPGGYPPIFFEQRRYYPKKQPSLKKRKRQEQFYNPTFEALTFNEKASKAHFSRMDYEISQSGLVNRRILK